MYRKGPKPKPPKGCLWIEGAAEHLGLEPNTLRKWRLTGKDKDAGMPSFKVGGYVAYKIADLDAYLHGQYQAAVAPDEARAHESRPPEPRISRKPARAAA
ncbi:helix-turn-helix domain-containing protein [Streptomyces sp. NPDC006355]|uniref:helix-turn-helix domain-containing protein n=1 Tax=Streptomyces sp. NPDC006355 TaxID=3156758 RepID=UPI0033A33319